MNDLGNKAQQPIEDKAELPNRYWQKRGNFHPFFSEALHFCYMY
jgi:hypothetical protein